MTTFDKPTYDFKGFTGHTGALIRVLPSLLKAIKSDGVDSAMREKLFLAVTGANRCRYCGFVHARLGKAAGVEPETIKCLLQAEPDPALSEGERKAVLFAQNFAFRGGEPDPHEYEKLAAHYGEQAAAHMLAYLRGIELANLTGNTFDGFLSRFRGKKPVDGELWFEALLFLFGAPVLFPTLLLLKIRKRRPDGEGVIESVPE